MAFLNEVDQSTASNWLTNFNAASGNIFEVFQSNTILLSKSIYETLSRENQNNIRIYFGLDDNEIPKVIALASYYLQTGDYSEVGYTDLIVEDGIYELYSGNIISFSEAKLYIDNWKVNLNENLFKFGFLIPKPNTVKFFMEDQLNNLRLYFGIDDQNEIKLLMQKPNGGSSDVIADSCIPCPSFCPIDTRMID